jgi:hypothetical protein
VRNSNSQLLLGCTEMPLMQFGAINTGRYKAGALPQGTNLFSWPMNNYWVTNFNAEQRGGHSWKYYFTSSGDPTDVYASKFGWGCRVPYLTRILPGDGSGDGKNEGSFITGWPSNVILVASEPGENENSLLMQLRETGGRHSDIKLVNGLTGKELKVREVDANGKDVAALTTPDKAPAVTVSASAAAVPSIGPHESKFFRISLE